MSIRSIGAIAVLAASALCAAPAVWAQDATVKQVYEAAEAGKFIEAQAMMDKVLAAHPNSAKAHFIEAELLAKQGKMARAGTELATAERLAPGLPFAKPAAVEKLRTLVAGAKARTAPAAAAPVQPRAAAPDMSYERQAPASGGGMPWGMIMLGVGLAALVAMYLKNKSAARAAQGRYSPTAGPAGAPGVGAPYPQYANPGQAPYGPAAAPGGGLGSGIMGGLATGAALGAGMVAGQALAHHFTDGNRSNHDSNANNLTPDQDQLTPLDQTPSGYDMGGSDFGVSDPGSWDSGGGDSGGGGGGEWD